MINKKNFKTFEELQEFTIENKDFIKIINIERVYEDREITNHVYYNSFIGYDLYFENKKEKIEDWNLKEEDD